jgi:hypothetical protein
MFIACQFRLSAAKKMRGDLAKIRDADDSYLASGNVASGGIWSYGVWLIGRGGKASGKKKDRGVLITPRHFIKSLSRVVAGREKMLP